MKASVTGTSIKETLLSRLSGAENRLILSNPSESMLETVIDTAADDDSIPEVAVMAESTVIDRVVDDFLTGSKAADLVMEDRLELRYLPETIRDTVIVTEDRLTMPVQGESGVGAFRSEDPTFVDPACEQYRTAFDKAGKYHLNTPPLNRVFDELADSTGEKMVEDLKTVLPTVGSNEEAVDGADIVLVSLLIGAKNDELVYDLSKWGENSGVASSATFSRSKRDLEEVGVINTEKVPIELGRPRQKLHLTEQYEQLPARELISVAIMQLD